MFLGAARTRNLCIVPKAAQGSRFAYKANSSEKMGSSRAMTGAPRAGSDLPGGLTGRGPAVT
jgi:hypothetical protein